MAAKINWHRNKITSLSPYVYKYSHSLTYLPAAFEILNNVTACLDLTITFLSNVLQYSAHAVRKRETV